MPELVILRGHEIKDDGIVERRLANLAEFAWTHVHRPCEYIKDYDMTEAERQEGCKLILLRNFRFICKDAATPTLFDGGKVERPQEDRAAWEASADEVKAKLSSATHVEMTYEDQKSGIKGVILVSRANMMFRGVGEDTCAVQSAARIVEDIIRQGGSKNTGINTVWLEGHANSQGKKTVLNRTESTRFGPRDKPLLRLAGTLLGLMCVRGGMQAICNIVRIAVDVMCCLLQWIVVY